MKWFEQPEAENVVFTGDHCLKCGNPTGVEYYWDGNREEKWHGCSAKGCNFDVLNDEYNRLIIRRVVQNINYKKTPG